MPDALFPTVEAVGSLSAHRAARLAARLIRADASASGIPADAIRTGPPHSGGGGEDGYMAVGSPRRSAHGLVAEGTTAYLFLAGRRAADGPFDDILFPRGGEAAPWVRRCVEDGGTLAALMFGLDGADGSAVSAKLEEALAAGPCGRGGARVEVWTRGMIGGVARRFPSIALGLHGAGHAGTNGHLEWSGHADMGHAFRRGHAENEVMGRIRACLRGGAGAGGAAPAHAVISGAPGSGKTRIVLEATRTDDLAARVVYAAGPDEGHAAIDELSQRWRDWEGAILVVDECSPSHRARMWNRLAHGQSGIDLVTMNSEAEDTSGPAEHIAVGDMGGEQIAEIIAGRAPGIGGAEAERWAESCTPSPRAAHMVGENLARDPGDVLAPPSTVRVWERWLAGKDEAGGGEYRDRRTVMMWLSLFTEFGFDAPHGGDAAQIARMAQRSHAGMTQAAFREAARALRARGVLRGGPVLRIAPRILQDYMWIQWWEYYGPEYGAAGPLAGEEGEEDGGGGPLPPLRARYLGMLSRMQSNRGSMRAAERLFGRGGMLEGARGPAAAPSNLAGAPQGASR